jgi:dUTP pyrophosphatase
MLFVTKLDAKAMLPTCSHPGEDLGFDIYALEDVEVNPHSVTKVRTGISAQYAPWGDQPEWQGKERYGLLVKDRSSVAASGLFTVAGVIDSSYTGEIIILFRNVSQVIIDVKAGQKIAQLIPTLVRTGCRVKEIDVLPYGKRGYAGFGSTGR